MHTGGLFIDTLYGGLRALYLTLKRAARSTCPALPPVDLHAKYTLPELVVSTGLSPPCIGAWPLGVEWVYGLLQSPFNAHLIGLHQTDDAGIANYMPRKIGCPKIYASCVLIIQIHMITCCPVSKVRRTPLVIGPWVSKKFGLVVSPRTTRLCKWTKACFQRGEQLQG